MLKPTPARIRAMREALSRDGFIPEGPGGWSAYRSLKSAGLMVLVVMPDDSYRRLITPAGRAWLAQHDKEADRG